MGQGKKFIKVGIDDTMQSGEQTYQEVLAIARAANPNFVSNGAEQIRDPQTGKLMYVQINLPLDTARGNLQTAVAAVNANRGRAQQAIEVSYGDAYLNAYFNRFEDEQVLAGGAGSGSVSGDTMWEDADNVAINAAFFRAGSYSNIEITAVAAGKIEGTLSGLITPKAAAAQSWMSQFIRVSQYPNVPVQNLGIGYKVKLTGQGGGNKKMWMDLGFGYAWLSTSGKLFVLGTGGSYNLAGTIAADASEHKIYIDTDRVAGYTQVLIDDEVVYDAARVSSGTWTTLLPLQIGLPLANSEGEDATGDWGTTWRYMLDEVEIEELG